MPRRRAPSPSPSQERPVLQGVALETVILVALTTFFIGLLVGRTVKIRREVFLPRTMAGAGDSLPAGHPPIEGSSAADPQEVRRQVEEAQKAMAGIADREELVHLGHQFFDQGQPIQAIAAYELALRKNDQDPNVWTDLGVMYRRVGLSEKAAQCFRQALSLDPRHPQSRLNLGIVLAFDLDQVEAAQREWRTLLQQGGPSDILQQARALLEEVEGEAQGPALSLGQEGKRLMVEMSTTFTALASAAREGSLAAARSPLAQMEALAQRFASLPPIQDLGPMVAQPFQRAVEEARRALERGDAQALREAVKGIKERCNRCHAMMRVPTQVEE